MDKKRLSKRALVMLIVSVAALTLLVMGLSVLLYFQGLQPSVIKDKAPVPPFFDNSERNVLNDRRPGIEITVEQANRPESDNELYVNKASGLFTAEGAAEYVMPSAALINVYDTQLFAPIGYGSGVVMSANGYIITNAHVVAKGKRYSVTLSDGEVYEAVLMGMDIGSDVAVLKIDADGLTPATFGKTEDLRIGEEVAVIANSGSTFDNFATFGRISNTSRVLSTTTTREVECFQTDAAINAGTSGGPIANMYGQVIGIVIGKYINLESGMFENMGFGLQIDNVLKTAETLIENGFIPGEVKLGFYYSTLDNVTASYYDLPSGLLVDSVVPGGGAEAAGLLPNDIVISVNNVEVLTSDSVADALSGLYAGDAIPVVAARKQITGELDIITLTVIVQQKIDMPSNNSYAAE
jgi:serine protease Do